MSNLLRPSPSSSRTLARGLLVLLLTLSASTVGAEVTARISHSPVGLDDSFQLVFEASGSVDDEPDFGPLEQDFEILGQQQSQNIQMINGRFSRSTSWTLSLMAKRAGSLGIPAISFGKDRSPPLAIEVRESAAGDPAQPGEELFLEVEAQPGSPYVQAQVLYTVRLFVADSLAKVSLRKLTEPRTEGVDVVLQQIGEDSQYRTRRNGRPYRVLERQYALFPQQSGALRLEPVLFEGKVMGKDMDPLGMFNSQLFNRGRGQIRRTRSQPLEIQVQPAPAGSGVHPWLPVKHLQLAESWSEETERLEVGQTVTRTLVLIADGLTAAQLPPTLTRSPLPEGLKEYPDQPVLKDQASSLGVTGTRQEKSAIIATRPGAYTLPGIRIDWWNTKTGRRETTTTPPRRIEVVAAPGSAPATAPPVHEQAAAPADRPQPNPEPSAPVETPVRTVPSPGIFVWLSLFLGLGWLGTALAWWRLGKNRNGDRALPKDVSSQDRASERKALSRVRGAYEAGDAEAAQRALLAWGGARWPEAQPTSLGALAQRCSPEARVAVEQLSRARYRRNSESWNQTRIWTLLDKNRYQYGTNAVEADPHAPLAKLNP